MINIIKLINIAIVSYSYHFLWCGEIYPLHKFLVHNAFLLTIATMLYIRSPEFIHLIIGNFAL